MESAPQVIFKLCQPAGCLYTARALFKVARQAGGILVRDGMVCCLFDKFFRQAVIEIGLRARLKIGGAAII